MKNYGTTDDDLVRRTIDTNDGDELRSARSVVHGVLFMLALIAGTTALWWFLDYLIDYGGVPA